MGSEAHEKNRNITFQAPHDAFVKSTLYASIQGEIKAWMKNVGLPQENYGTKNPLWTLEARTELQLTTKKLSGKIFHFLHFFLPHIKSLSFPCEI